MRYGCIARKLSHSFSKIIHEQICDYQYELLELEPDEVGEFLTKREFDAINVTIPYKQTVIPYLDEVSDIAKTVGAVNTIVNRGGKLYGYNTDFYGLKALLEKNGVDPKGKKCALLGTGGTSKTATEVLKFLGADKIVVVSRSEGEGVVTYDTFTKYHSDTQIIINTTPCGMYPDTDASPVDIDGFDNLECVADAIYNPLRSRLVISALERGINAFGGLYMLVSQAVYAIEHFIDTKIDKSVTDRVYKNIFKQKQNIVLIGMPGCGKTTLGKMLSDSIGVKFYDSDKLIEEFTSSSIPDIFEKSGEDGFRRIESEVIAELSKKTGCVISTGGGAVMKKENVRALRQNGLLVFIDRPIDMIECDSSRPLSPDRERLTALYKKRFPVYSSVCDIRLKSSGTEKETFGQLVEYLNDCNY